MGLGANEEFSRIEDFMWASVLRFSWIEKLIISDFGCIGVYQCLGLVSVYESSMLTIPRIIENVGLENPYN